MSKVLAGKETSEPASPVESAVEAGLIYVSDQEPGIRRVGPKSKFSYLDPAGKAVRDDATLKRIRSLVIPPNWSNVWICANPRGHLQATGRDARDRKQYRYHPRYRSIREETKYEKMVLFGHVLPRIRQRVNLDLSLPGLRKEKVLAAVVRLMDLTQIRVGNEEYARENQSFGLTTMRDRHVQIQGSKIRFRFRGKSGKEHSLDLDDRRLAEVVKRCRDVPGYELFQYIDETGAHVSVDSGMVNQYLKEISGEEITAKDFRTWHGTVEAAVSLAACEACATQTAIKQNIVIAIKEVSARLGNLPAACRKYYVHPLILEMYATGALTAKVKVTRRRVHASGLGSAERSVLKLLEHSAAQNGTPPRSNHF